MTAMSRMVRRIALFSVVGGLFLTPLDALQIAFGVESVGSQPWMTPIRFLLVGAAVALASEVLDPRPRDENLRAVVTDGALFAGGYLCTMLHVRGADSAIVAYYVVLLSFLAWRAGAAGLLRETLVFAVLLALVGPTAEGIVMRMSGFQYAAPTMHGLPVWLPFQYAAAAPLVRGLAAEASRRERAAEQVD
jgi:hypothetical protein